MKTTNAHLSVLPASRADFKKGRKFRLTVAIPHRVVAPPAMSAKMRPRPKKWSKR